MCCSRRPGTALTKLIGAGLATILVGLTLCACDGETPTATTPPIGEPTVIDLAAVSPALTIFGADAGDLTSDMPALAMGDFNGDGISDLLVGARFADGPDNEREDAGEAYVIFGSAELPATVDLAASQQDVTILGAKPGDNLGYAATSADVNNDGIDDIIVSAPFSEGPPPTRNDRGETYVFFGSPDLGGVIDTAEEEQDVTIFAAEGFALLGDSLASGDVNGDGISDIIMGAPFAGRVPGTPVGGPRTEVGEVYVVFGSPTLSGRVSIPDNEQDFTVVGAERSGELGESVACADVNGDGIDDILATAEAADGPEGERPNAGEAYVMFGSPELGGTVEISDGQQDLTILGADPQDALGYCLSSGNVNGDSQDDILLVAQRAAGLADGRSASGEAYVILGSADLAGSRDVLLGEQDITIFGADAHDLLGFCHAGQDLDGDGLDDVILGASFGSGPNDDKDAAGEVYVIFGSTALTGTMDLAEGWEDIIIFGAESGDRLGTAAAVGDLNGDDKNELILVAADADGPHDARPDAGDIYVIATS